MEESEWILKPEGEAEVPEIIIVSDAGEALVSLCQAVQHKNLSFWQLASVVLNEGCEAYTTNLCQKCFNKHLQAKGEEPLSNVQWRQVVEKKAYRGKRWKMMGKEPFLRGM